jgi:hypothetical protein
MSLSTAIVLLVAVALVIFLVRRKRPASERRPAVEKSVAAGSKNAFHAVSLKFASTACAAAKSLEGKRFLSGAAPRIPLPECDVPECKCRFVHHQDRRAGDDRRSPFSAGFTGETGRHPQEQRQQSDRRKDSEKL